MILVDTTVWIDFFNNINNLKVRLLEKYIKKDRIAIGDIIKIELLQGFKSDNDYNTTKELISKLEYVSLLNNDKIVDKCIEIYRSLRKKGITIRKTIDLIIASYCIEKKVKLLHNDSDFDNIAKYYNLITIDK